MFLIENYLLSFDALKNESNKIHEMPIKTDQSTENEKPKCQCLN